MLIKKEETMKRLKEHLQDMTNLINDIEKNQNTNDTHIELMALHSDTMLCYIKLLKINKQ